MPSKVELIAYADRFGGDLAGLGALLDGPLAGLFGGVHILPFFRPYDGADAGFDPEDHTEVDPRLGSWADVSALSAGYRVMADVIVNHISSSSPQFKDWLAAGARSRFDGMFLTYGAAFPAGATEDELLRLYRPRPGLPFTPYALADGSRRLLWTTFTPRPIDLDVRHPATRSYLLRVLDTLAGAQVAWVRLDAVGYAVKTAGRSSFMTPDTFAFIGELTGWCHDRGLDVLVEVHSSYLHQVEIARQVDYVYDFALPPLALHALTAADAGPSKEGISLVNGTQAMLSVGGLQLLEAETLAESADLICAMTIDGLRGTPRAFDPRIHEARPFPGQIQSAANLTRYLEGSEIRQSHITCRRVQDAYSLRCAPQVHGAVRDALATARRAFEIELNSVTDNPLVIDDEIFSGGNFHGEPLALQLDAMAVALTVLARASPSAASTGW